MLRVFTGSGLWLLVWGLWVKVSICWYLRQGVLWVASVKGVGGEKNVKKKKHNSRPWCGKCAAGGSDTCCVYGEGFLTAYGYSLAVSKRLCREI